MAKTTENHVVWFACSGQVDRQLAIFPTDIGWMGLEWTNAAVRRSVLGHRSAQSAQQALASADRGVRRRWEPIAASAADPAARDVVRRLRKYSSDPRDDLADVPIALDGLSRFQQRVLAACRRIRPGQTSTYRRLAAAAGSPNAARAVGNVMASNRFAPIVPCHRVLASGGGLGGYSAPAGLDLKRVLLAAEAGSTPQPAGHAAD